MSMKYLKKWFNLKATPQAQAIPGTSQVMNDNAGYAWAVDDWTRLDRFLILGSEGGSYYASEQKLTRGPRPTRCCLRWRSARSSATSRRVGPRTRRYRGWHASARTCSISPST